MSEIVLFHHVLGLTPGVRKFAETLRAAGHAVHLPDLYEGRVFATLDEGAAHAQVVGSATLIARGEAAVTGLPEALVYAGFSLGVMPAQKLAQTRQGAKGALLCEACVPPSVFGTDWPNGVPVQIHGMDNDPFFAGEGDIEAARGLVKEAGAELFTYAGSRHLFADDSLPSYDAAAAALLTERVLAFLARLDAR